MDVGNLKKDNIASLDDKGTPLNVKEQIWTNNARYGHMYW